MPLSSKIAYERSEIALKEFIDATVQSKKTNIKVHQNSRWNKNDFTSEYELKFLDEFLGAWEYNITFKNGITYYLDFYYSDGHWNAFLQKK